MNPQVFLRGPPEGVYGLSHDLIAFRALALQRSNLITPITPSSLYLSIFGN